MCDAGIKREEHFRKEKRIIVFYIMAFIMHLILCLMTVVESEIEPELCDLTCKILVGSASFGSLTMFIIYLFAVTRLVHWAKKRHNYLYKQYRRQFILQSVLMLIAILASNIYNINMYLIKIKVDNLGSSVLVRMLLYLAIVVPPFAISMANRPRDLFSEFNRYPEQLQRVSSLQYKTHYYGRFSKSMDQ